MREKEKEYGEVRKGERNGECKGQRVEKGLRKREREIGGLYGEQIFGMEEYPLSTKDCFIFIQLKTRKMRPVLMIFCTGEAMQISLTRSIKYVGNVMYH